jgi:hypothetical protein
LTDQQLASINALNQQLLGNQQQVGNLLVPQLQSILNNPGLSPADKAAVTAQSQGSLASAFDALQQSAANRAARSRNSAGFGELADEFARQTRQKGILRWLHRRMRNDEITRAFVRDIATNHLPHIYNALKTDRRAAGN